jgi:hypothetical protein
VLRIVSIGRRVVVSRTKGRKGRRKQV